MQLSLPEEGREGQGQPSNHGTPIAPARPIRGTQSAPGSQISNVNSNAQNENEGVAVTTLRELACLHVEVRARAAETKGRGP